MIFLVFYHFPNRCPGSGVVLDLSIPDICLLYFNFIEIVLNFRISELKHFLRCTFMTQFVQSSLSSCVLICINVLISFLPSQLFFNNIGLSHELNHYQAEDKVSL